MVGRALCINVVGRAICINVNSKDVSAAIEEVGRCVCVCGQTRPRSPWQIV